MAQARSVGSLFIDIEARTARLEADLAKTKTILQRMSRDVAIMSRGFSQAFGMMKAAIGAFVGVASIRGLNNMVLAQYENVRALMALADQTSLTTQQVQAYQKASEFLNVTNLDLQKTMQRLLIAQGELRRGNRQAAQDFTALGLSADYVRSAMPGELFEKTIEQIGRLRSAADRATVSQRLFGRGAADLEPLFRGGSRAIAQARKDLEDTNTALSLMDTTKVRVALGAINELQDRWQGFKQRLAVGLAPLFYTMANHFSAALQNIDVDELSQKISEMVVRVYSFLVTVPERLSIAFNTVKLQILELRQMLAGNSLTDLFGVLGMGSKTVFPDVTPQIEETKQKLQELRNTIQTMSVSVEGDFDQKVQELLRVLNVVHVVATKEVSDASRIMVETFSSAFSQLSDVLADFVTEGEANFADFGRMVVKQMISMFLKLSLLNPLMNAVFGGMTGWTTLPTVPGLARGGPVVSGDVALVGEKGPELVQFHRSGQVIPTQQTMRTLDNGGAMGLTINVPFTIMPGVSHAEFAAKIPEIINMAKGAVAEAVLRGGSYGRAMRA